MCRSKCFIAVVFSLLALLLWTGQPAVAQRSGQALREFDGVGMNERLGERVPKGLTFYNEQGEQVTIGQYLGAERPVVLSMVYHNCPMLCNLMTDGLVQTLRDMSWTPGDQFEVLTVSFAPDEEPDLARRQKAKYLKDLGRPEAARGWHFLTGDEASIQQLAQAIGFQFRWDEQTQQYAHPAVLTFLSPEGKITRYLYGLERPARDMRNALVEAGNGTVGNVIDQAILYCFQYDPDANSYVAQAFNIMKLGGLLTMLVLGAMLFIFWRREGQSLNTSSSSWPTPSS